MVCLTPWPHWPKAPTEGPLIGTPEAGRILGMTASGVKHHIANGQLTVVGRGVNNCLLVRRDEVERLAAVRSQRPSRPPAVPFPFGGRAVLAARLRVPGLRSWEGVQRAIRDGQIRAERWRNRWYVDPASLRGYRSFRRPPGLGPTLLTTEDVAALFGITPNGVRVMLCRGHLPSVKIGPFRYILRDDAERLARDGWRGRKWCRILNPYEARFRRDELARVRNQRYRAQRREAAS